LNAIEIEEAISTLVEEAFDRESFPYRFLEAFGNKSTTIKRLRDGSTNKSDIGNGVLQYNNIHIATCEHGKVGTILELLRNSRETQRQKAKFILATDGETLEAEDVATSEHVSCHYKDLPNHFGFFLSLAGISTVQQIRESSIDIRATSGLNKLYIELLNTNPEWGTEERRHDMNHFMARLIFCFFAEDTNIFSGQRLFTHTVETLSDARSGNTPDVIQEIFRAMNTSTRHNGILDDRYRREANIRSWAKDFPYVNGGLFSGSIESPKFSQIARSYLLNVGRLDWRQINPDIFGSMIQAVADDEERGSLGMHYTSVPNILKVLNPLFLDDLRAKLEEAGDNSRKLLNLRNRMAKIRVFDPACGSGNFLVIAYKQMREIEAEINRRRGNPYELTKIPLSNFRGIEIRDFAAEIARLALIIAEYQCNVLYLREQQQAIEEFLPLDSENWITCDNSLRRDWLSVCPPIGKSEDQSEVEFQNEGGETYICGNPPYIGDKKQNRNQKSDIEHVFAKLTNSWRSLDYICGFFCKAFEYLSAVEGVGAFVSTNSIIQGQHVSRFWGLNLNKIDICFAVTSFKWSNLATNKAGVTCVIVGFCPTHFRKVKRIYDSDNIRQVENISPYLTSGKSIIIAPTNKSISNLPKMTLGNVPKDDGGLLLTNDELEALSLSESQKKRWIKKALGSTELIQGRLRYCLWIEDHELAEAEKNVVISQRIAHVRHFRINSIDPGMTTMAKKPHQFREMNIASSMAIVIPRVSSENRGFLPTDVIQSDSIITDRNYAIYDQPLWCLSLIASRLHWVWIGTVCVRMRTDFSYSNTLGWNTFPVPILTEKMKTDLTKCAEDILLAREAHFPATIADLYNPENMPENLQHAHDRNDEVLERIYIGRRFKNDTERLEKLFELYTKITAESKPSGRKAQ